MLVAKIGYHPYNNYPKKPSFEGKKPFDLNYVLKNRSDLLPERVLKKVRTIAASDIKPLPTLQEVHKTVYGPLLNCKTLDEAKELFPEFSKMREADFAFERYTGNIKRLTENGYLENNFALKMLQEVWANLKSQDEIAKKMGLKGRTGLGWILQKIGFVNYKSNYKTLLMSSDPETRAVIAAKTTAWNAAHPDLMKAKNKHAAQFCKTPEYKKAHSERMFEYDKLHPERREKIREFDRAVWAKIPDVRAAMSNFARNQGGFIKQIIKKTVNGFTLTPEEMRVKKGFYKKFWKAHPEMLEKFKQAHKLVREERAMKKSKI